MRAKDAYDEVVSIADRLLVSKKVFRGAMPEDDEPGGTELHSKANGFPKRLARGVAKPHHGAHNNTQGGIDDGRRLGGRGNLAGKLMEKSSTPSKEVPFLLRVAPGLRNLLEYRREWLRHDAVAGVSVAAVALPTTLAYAQLIGFDPVVGLYAAILPLLLYAVFGTSRHLIYRAFRLSFHLGPVAHAVASGLTTHSRTRRLSFPGRCQMKVRRPQGLVLVGVLQ